MKSRIELAVDQWAASRITAPVSNVEEVVIELNLNKCRFTAYLHSLTPQLISMISLTLLKKYPKADTASTVRQMVKCLKILRLSQWAMANGVALYLHILKNKLAKLIDQLVKFEQVLDGQLYGAMSNVISGYIRRFQMEFGATLTEGKESLFSIVEIIKSSIVNRRKGLLSVLFPTKILLVTRVVDELIEFIEVNVKNSGYNINLFNDWRMEELADNLNRLQMKMKNIGFKDLKGDLELLLDRYEALSETKDDIRKQFKISSPTINEKRRSSGLQFSLVKVYNED